jgi:hypothetical protein
MIDHSTVRTRKFFILVTALLFLLMFIMEKINGRFWLNDFKVFYSAADALINNKKVYGIPFGLETGFYKYSPFTLLIFAPFTFFDYEVAAIIYFFLYSACIISCLLLITKIISGYFFDYKYSSWLIYIVLIFSFNHIVRELHLGNTNMLLLFLLSLSLKYSLEEKYISAGLLLALVVLTKPYFLICLLPLILFKKFKTITYCLLSIVGCIFISIFYSGFTDGLNLYTDWISAMKEHSNYLTSFQTIFALLKIYSSITLNSGYGILTLGLFGILLFIYFYWLNALNVRFGFNDIEDKNLLLVVYYYLLIALVPSILITDIEHFLFTLPLITIIIIWSFKEIKILPLILLAIIFFLYGGNTSELWGKKMAAVFEDNGFLGIGNIIIIITVLFLIHTQLRPAKKALA